jgi:hypothetical protein
VSGHRIARLSARTITAIPVRSTGRSLAFQRSAAGPRVAVAGEDAVTMMFETDRGAAGTLIISQVSQGRKIRLWFEIDAASEAIAFDQEHPEELWIGSGERQETVLRDPRRSSLPRRRATQPCRQATRRATPTRSTPSSPTPTPPCAAMCRMVCPRSPTACARRCTRTFTAASSPQPRSVHPRWVRSSGATR